jgi:hypothetical protein
MIRVRLPFLLMLLLTACAANPRRADPFGAVPDDFSVDLTILSRPEGGSADRRTSRIVLEPDGTLRYLAKPGIGPNTLPPLVRRLDREQMARVWDSAARLGLTDPSQADVDADLRRVRPPSRRGCVWLLVLTGDGDRWNFTRTADGDEQPDAAIVAFGRELGVLAWATDRPVRVAEIDPVRWDYGPDPWAAYRGTGAATVQVASAQPPPAIVEVPPPPPKPAIVQPVAPPPAPKIVEPPPPVPAAKPTPKVTEPAAPPPPAAPRVKPPPAKPKAIEPPPAPKPAPKVAPPPPPQPPTPKPASTVAAAPPPPTPAPRVVERIPPPPAQPPPKAQRPKAPKWPLHIRRIHVVWGRTHEDLPTLAPAMLLAVPLEEDGDRLIAPRRPGDGVQLSIDAINDRGGATLDPSAVRAIKNNVRVYTELAGMLGARIQAKLESPASPGGPLDLWLIVEIPMSGAKLSSTIPPKLLRLPPAPVGTSK